MLNGSHVLSYAACPRIVFLDLHGDRDARSPSSDFLKMLGEQGKDHEDAIVSDLSAYRIGFDRHHPELSLRRTREAMADGLPMIAAAPLDETDADGNLVRLGVADLLERVPCASDLVDFHYEVIEIKRASRAKPSYRLQVAYHSDLLAQVQGVYPVRGHLILSDGRREGFDLAPLMSRY